MERKTLIAILAVTVFAVVCISSLAAARGFDGFIGNYSEEEREAIREQEQAINDAIRDGDFSTWKSLMEEKIAQMESQLTEENFNAIVERQAEMESKRAEMEARESGNFSEGKDFKGMDFRFQAHGIVHGPRFNSTEVE